jgi:hypothetical protein
MFLPGSGVHDCGAARYREIDPHSTIMAASSLQDFDAQAPYTGPISTLLRI